MLGFGERHKAKRLRQIWDLRLEYSPVNCPGNNRHAPNVRTYFSNMKTKPPKNPVVNKDNTSSSSRSASSAEGNSCVTESCLTL